MRICRPHLCVAPSISFLVYNFSFSLLLCERRSSVALSGCQTDRQKLLPPRSDRSRQRGFYEHRTGGGGGGGWRKIAPIRYVYLWRRRRLVSGLCLRCNTQEIGMNYIGITYITTFRWFGCTKTFGGGPPHTITMAAAKTSSDFPAAATHSSQHNKKRVAINRAFWRGDRLFYRYVDSSKRRTRSDGVRVRIQWKRKCIVGIIWRVSLLFLGWNWGIMNGW